MTDPVASQSKPLIDPGDQGQERYHGLHCRILHNGECICVNRFGKKEICLAGLCILISSTCDSNRICELDFLLNLFGGNLDEGVASRFSNLFSATKLDSLAGFGFVESGLTLNQVSRCRDRGCVLAASVDCSSLKALPPAFAAASVATINSVWASWLCGIDQRRKHRHDWQRDSENTRRYHFAMCLGIDSRKV